jgi:hypothetical protein
VTAGVNRVDPDRGRARDFIVAAERFLADAEQTAHQESAVVLCWQACLSSLDAILAVEGLVVGSGEGGHRIRIEVVRDLVGKGYAELFDRLDEWRRERNDVSYAAITPADAAAAAMMGDTRDVVALAAVHVSAGA